LSPATSTTTAVAGVRQRAVAARPVRSRYEYQDGDDGSEQERTNGGEAGHGAAVVCTAQCNAVS
jgi:hypothetical protein